MEPGSINDARAGRGAWRNIPAVIRDGIAGNMEATGQLQASFEQFRSGLRDRPTFADIATATAGKAGVEEVRQIAIALREEIGRQSDALAAQVRELQADRALLRQEVDQLKDNTTRQEVEIADLRRQLSQKAEETTLARYALQEDCDRKADVEDVRRELSRKVCREDVDEALASKADAEALETIADRLRLLASRDELREGLDGLSADLTGGQRAQQEQLGRAVEELQAVQEALPGLATTAAVERELKRRVTQQTLDARISRSAASTLETADQRCRERLEEVRTALRGKAGRADVSRALSNKADLDEVRSVLAGKADVAAVADALRSKAEAGSLHALRQAINKAASGGAIAHIGRIGAAGGSESRDGAEPAAAGHAFGETAAGRRRRAGHAGRAAAAASTASAASASAHAGEEGKDPSTMDEGLTNLFSVGGGEMVRALGRLEAQIAEKASARSVHDLTEGLHSKASAGALRSAVEASEVQGQRLAEVLQVVDELRDRTQDLDTIRATSEEAGRAAERALARSAAVASTASGRWIWRSRRLTGRLLVPWDIQAVNTAPRLLEWVDSDAFRQQHAGGRTGGSQLALGPDLDAAHAAERGEEAEASLHAAATVIAVKPGLYRCQIGFFSSTPPSVTILVDGRPAATMSPPKLSDYAKPSEAAAATGRSGRRPASGRRARAEQAAAQSGRPVHGTVTLHTHPAGTVAGVTMTQFLALPARARVSVLYDGDVRGQGFLEMSKM